MKKHTSLISQNWARLALLVLAAAILTACGGDDPTPEPTAVVEPTATTAAEPPTATPEEPAEDVQSESPLDQPESPLSQPESPLTVAIPALPMSEEEAIALAATTEAPVPDEGFGSLSGVLWSYQTNQAIYGIQVYLVAADEYEGEPIAPAVLLGPSEGDVTGTPNPAAQLLLNNIPPGDYYMVVWTVYNWLLVYPDPSGAEAPRLITIEEGDQQQLGVLYVDWP